MANFNYQGVADTVARNRSSAENVRAWLGLLNTVGEVMQQRRTEQKREKFDAIADTLSAPRARAVDAANPDASLFSADELSGPTGGGVEGLKLRHLMRGDDLDTAMKKARIKKLLEPQIPRGRAVDPMSEALNAARLRRMEATAPGDDGLTPAQRVQLQMQRDREARLTNAPRGRAADPAKMFEERLKTETGTSVADWTNFVNPRMVRQKGEADAPKADAPTYVGSNSGNFFQAEVPDAKGGMRTILLPRKSYEAGHEVYNSYLKSRNGAPVAEPDAAPASVAAPTAAKVRVLHPDGKTTGMIPVGQLDAALAQGFKQI